MTVKSVRENRLEWIDWMKAIGIYLIILGHFYSVGEKWIYVFHVPLFFVISGFLTSKESDCRKFWQKLWYNLVVPMLIMASMSFVYACVIQQLHGTFELKTFYWFFRNVLFGMVAGFDNLWFVYTLILLKIICQFFTSRKWLLALTMVMMILACAYNHADMSAMPFFLINPNCIINVCLAMPFMAFGVMARDYKVQLDDWNNKVLLIIATFVGGLMVSLCGHYNSLVGLHSCSYGDNLLLFLLGALAGTMMAYAICKLLGHSPKIITIISRGTIVILAFHKIIIGWWRDFFPASSLDVFAAAVILLLFVPIVRIAESYFPLMVGKYRVNRLKNML